MNGTFLAVRAIGVAFANRMLRPMLLGGSFLAITVIVLSIWLVQINSWWLVLAIPAYGAILLFVLMVLVVRFGLRMLAPAQTKQQKRAVTAFTDKLQRVADNVKTPPFIILFYVIRDILRPRPDNFITTLSKESTTLPADFTALKKLFN